MSELGRDAKALLAEARDSHDPTPEDRARMRAKVMAAVAALPASQLAASQAQAAPAAGSAAAGGAGIGGVVKVAAAALVVAGLSAGGYFWAAGPEGEAPLVVAEALMPPAVEEVAEHAEPRPPLEPLTEEPELADAAAPAIAAPPVEVRPRGPARPAREHPPRDVSTDLAEETALLEAARASLREGSGAAALEAVKAHARRFPEGLLAEEREAARILALCALDRRAEAARAREDLRARWPSSPHGRAIEAACAD